MLDHKRRYSTVSSMSLATPVVWSLIKLLPAVTPVNSRNSRNACRYTCINVCHYIRYTSCSNFRVECHNETFVMVLVKKIFVALFPLHLVTVVMTPFVRTATESIIARVE